MSGRTLFKVTTPDGMPVHGGSGQWPLPREGRRGWARGRWRKVRGDLRACEVGLHLTDEQHVGSWLPTREAFTVWEAEGRGETIESGSKIVYREARLVRPIITIDAAQAALRKQYEKTHYRGLQTLADVEAFVAWTAAIPQPGKPIVFGVHRLPVEGAISPAWPSASSLNRMNFDRMVRRSRRILGIPESLDRACRTGDPGAIRLAATWERAS